MAKPPINWCDFYHLTHGSQTETLSQTSQIYILVIKMCFLHSTSGGAPVPGSWCFFQSRIILPEMGSKASAVVLQSNIIGGSHIVGIIIPRWIPP